MTKFSSKFIMYYPVRLRLLLQRRRHRHRHRHRHQHRQQRFPMRHHLQQRLHQRVHQRLQQRLLSGSHGPLGTKEQAVMRRTTGVTSLSQQVLRSSTTRRGCTPLPLASSDAHRRKRRNASASAAVRPTDETQAAAGATTKSSARAEVMRRIGGKCNKLGRRDLRGHSTRILASGGWSSRGGRRHALRGRRRRGGAAHRRLKL